MNKPKFRAWKKIRIQEMFDDVVRIDWLNNKIAIKYPNPGGNTFRIDEESLDNVILMQYSDYNDEENLDEIWESDLLEIESPKGKFIAEVVKENGTMGMVAVKGCIVDYFTDHWNDHFMPLFDLYWNENGDDGCLPKSKRLGSKYENPDLLNEVEK